MSDRRFAMRTMWALTLLVPFRPVAAQAPRVAVTFGRLPAAWTAQQNRMDEIWRPLGVRGVNYYAFGGPVPPNGFAARSDPSSPLYQAWLGAYVVVGGLDSASAGDTTREAELFAHLAEYDQRSWLAAMGDPAPVADLVGHLRRSQVVIDGGIRSLFVGDMRSHSDLCVPATPLAKGLGMPPAMSWQGRLTPYHDVVLHVQGAVWYDAARRVTIVVYGASAAFTTNAHRMHDNGPALDGLLRHLMRVARVVDDPASGAP